MLKEPLALIDAEKLVKAIIKSGAFAFSQHARDEMRADKLTDVDCVNVLRGGWCESVDLERNTWRYRMKTTRITVVVAFRSETELVVITAWRTVK